MNNIIELITLLIMTPSTGWTSNNSDPPFRQAAAAEDPSTSLLQEAAQVLGPDSFKQTLGWKMSNLEEIRCFFLTEQIVCVLKKSPGNSEISPSWSVSHWSSDRSSWSPGCAGHRDSGEAHWGAAVAMSSMSVEGMVGMSPLKNREEFPIWWANSYMQSSWISLATRKGSYGVNSIRKPKPHRCWLMYGNHPHPLIAVEEVWEWLHFVPRNAEKQPGRWGEP